MKRPRLVLSLVSLLGFEVAGCGPVEYLSQVGRRAAHAVDAAKAAGAEKLAPYEYTLATEYLHKAREEGGYAQYEVAAAYGRKAAAMGEKARLLSIERAQKGSAP